MQQLTNDMHRQQDEVQTIEGISLVSVFLQ